LRRFVLLGLLVVSFSTAGTSWHRVKSSQSDSVSESLLVLTLALAVDLLTRVGGAAAARVCFCFEGFFCLLHFLLLMRFEEGFEGFGVLMGVFVAFLLVSKHAEGSKRDTFRRTRFPQLANCAKGQNDGFGEFPAASSRR
jgi:hypothetical protein